MNDTFVISFRYVSDDTVVLSYNDASEVKVKKVDFERAFGPILSLPKENIIRDYSL